MLQESMILGEAKYTKERRSHLTLFGIVLCMSTSMNFVEIYDIHLIFYTLDFLYKHQFIAASYNSVVLQEFLYCYCYFSADTLTSC